MGSRNISPHPEHFHAMTMPPSWLNATRCSTPTVYAVRLCHKSVEIETKRPTCGYASHTSSSVRPALRSRRNIRCSNRALMRRNSVAGIVPVWFARLCIFVIQFCENSVKNLRGSRDANCKLLVFSSLHGTRNATKYLRIAPTQGIYNALSVLGLVSSMVERTGFQ